MKRKSIREKDIVTFMQSHREMSIDGNEFMAEFRRQADLLPVPASLSLDESKLLSDSMIETLEKIRAHKKKARHRFYVVLAAVLVAGSALGILLLIFPISGIITTYCVSVIIGISVVAFAGTVSSSLGLLD